MDSFEIVYKMAPKLVGNIFTNFFSDLADVPCLLDFLRVHSWQIIELIVNCAYFDRRGLLGEKTNEDNSSEFLKKFFPPEYRDYCLYYRIDPFFTQGIINAFASFLKNKKLTD